MADRVLVLTAREEEDWDDERGPSTFVALSNLKRRKIVIC